MKNNKFKLLTWSADIWVGAECLLQILCQSFEIFFVYLHNEICLQQKQYRHNNSSIFSFYFPLKMKSQNDKWQLVAV